LPSAAVSIAAVIYALLTTLEKAVPASRRYRMAWLTLGCSLLAVQAGLFYRHKKMQIGGYLDQQKSWAQEIQTRYLRSGELMSIGTPELMVLAHRRNSHRYLYIVEGIDSLIDAETAGGFEGWLEQISRTDPAVIGFRYAPGRFMDRLQEWLRARYQETRVGDWTLYVRNGS
jgi:hypothetical protein